MENSNTERFFGLVNWFNDFSKQLYTLYTKISKRFTEEFKLKEVKRYANSSLVQPWIADVFHMGFKGEMEYSIHVMTLFNRDKITHTAYDKIPSIIVVKIDGDAGMFSDSYWNLFSEDNLTIAKTKEGVIKGEIRVGDEDWKFSAFQVDLELFDSQNADSVISMEILPKLRMII